MKSSCSGNLPQSGTRSKVLRVAACLPCRVLLLSWEQEGEASPPAPKSWELEGCCRTNTPVPYAGCVQVLMGSAVLSKPICSFLLLLLAAVAFFFFFFFLLSAIGELDYCVVSQPGGMLCQTAPPLQEESP